MLQFHSLCYFCLSSSTGTQDIGKIFIWGVCGMRDVHSARHLHSHFTMRPQKSRVGVGSVLSQGQGQAERGTTWDMGRAPALC